MYISTELHYITISSISLQYLQAETESQGDCCFYKAFQVSTLNILKSFIQFVLHRVVVTTVASPVVDAPRTVQVKDIYLHKVKGFSYWPVQVCKVDEDGINLVYYETGETNCVPMPGAELVPFTEETIANLKLDQLKNKKLQKAIAAARASV